jgi:hypothetical protein
MGRSVFGRFQLHSGCKGKLFQIVVVLKLKNSFSLNDLRLRFFLKLICDF